MASIDIKQPNYLGNPGEDVSIPYDGNGYLLPIIDTIYDHVHSAQKVYPTLANGVTVTGGVVAWALGNFAVIVPANAISAPFDIHHVNISAYNANDTFELIFYYGADGSEVEMGRTRFTRLTNVGASPHTPMMSIIVPANSQIKAKLATQNGTSNTVTVTILYHTY